MNGMPMAIMHILD